MHRGVKRNSAFYTRAKTSRFSMKSRRQRRLSRQLIRILNYGDRGNDRVHVGKLEQFQDAWVYSGGNKPNAFVLAPDIMPHDHAQSRRIHVGNVGQVEDVSGV